METYDDALNAIKGAVEGISTLRNVAYSQYSTLVNQVLNNQINDEHKLEKIMDGLVDFCDEDRFIELYRSLCRHIYYQYPQLVGEHVALFRAQFETNTDKEQEK